MKEILFRCSSWADLMSDPKSKSVYKFKSAEISANKYNAILNKCIKDKDYEPIQYLIKETVQVEDDELSETAKSLCIKTWLQYKYGIHDTITSKFLEKGVAGEEDAITLLSKVDKTFYVNNKARMSNDFITGEWDILKDNHVIDIKCAWDAFSFFKHLKDKELDKTYYWQLQGYMALTGAKTAEVAYCLIDTPEHLVEKEITNLWYKLGQIDQESEDWINAEMEARNNMQFSDKIDAKERVIRFKIERNDEDIQKGYERVSNSRNWIENNLNGI